jgi:transcriptional regulator of acetoin/glycerol metabolism
VRELFNRMQRAALVAAGEALTPADLGLAPDASSGTAPAEGMEERALLEEALKRHEGSVSRAAEELGLSRQAFYRKMERNGIVLERRPRD